MALLKDYNESKKEWEGMGAGYIANSDGSNKYTPNDIKTIEDNIDTHEKDYILHAGYGTASGTNAKVITLSPAPTSYKEGMTVAFKNTTQNSGAVTINVNGLGAKTVLKSNGNALSSGNLKANSIYTVRYNGTSFILQGEGGEYGTALASDVLTGKTIGTEEGIVTGTMPNRGAPAQTITTQGGQYNISPGYYSGGSVKAQFTNLTSRNVRDGVNIGGIVGTYKGESIQLVAYDVIDSFFWAAGVTTKQRIIPASANIANKIFLTFNASQGSDPRYGLELPIPFTGKQLYSENKNYSPSLKEYVTKIEHSGNNIIITFTREGWTTVGMNRVIAMIAYS
ncbi:hypothetical protein [Tissierella pigra]|uniref:Uncharacterized protein n=1 Tax=Tissierella pigra TaxID=2607614 RepID=A0A6N7XMB6_9FIRM|nr:hypothetical protein [Tissierella pigra]MSU01922.1 hypothetical protein [Tissierella pigra]